MCLFVTVRNRKVLSPGSSGKEALLQNEGIPE